MHTLHNKQLVGFADLPSFLATNITYYITHYLLNSIPSLQNRIIPLDAGYPLLLQPLVDYQYQMPKSMGINILFTIPELTNDHTFRSIDS